MSTQWADDQKDFMIIVRTDASDTGYATGFVSVSDIITRCADNAYEAEYGDHEPDKFAVYRIGLGGPVRCSIEFVRQSSFGMVEVRVSWFDRSRKCKITESGCYRIAGW